MAYLETCKELQALRPSVQTNETGFALGEENHLKQLSDIKNELAFIPGLNEETRANTMKVIDSYIHIATHLDEVVQHFKDNYGVLYETPQALPLHTDHVEVKDTAEFRKTLLRLIDNTISAYIK